MNPESDPRLARSAIGAVAVVLVALALAAGFALGRVPDTDAVRADVTSRPTPSVVLAVRDLSRLEAASFHMERVVELTDEQSRLFGLVKAKDQILLVAVGDVVAGVDLAKLRDTDVALDADAGVQITLPAPEVLSTAIDEARTRVYGRSTDLLAERKEALEGLARQEAAQQLEQGARDAGVLDKARANAERTVRALLQSLGFARVVITWRSAG